MQKELSEKIEDSGKQAQVLQVAVAKFDKELKDSQKSLQELIKKVTAAA